MSWRRCALCWVPSTQFSSCTGWRHIVHNVGVIHKAAPAVKRFDRSAFIHRTNSVQLAHVHVPTRRALSTLSYSYHRRVNLMGDSNTSIWDTVRAAHCAGPLGHLTHKSFVHVSNYALLTPNLVISLVIIHLWLSFLVIKLIIFLLNLNSSVTVVRNKQVMVNMQLI